MFNMNLKALLQTTKNRCSWILIFTVLVFRIIGVILFAIWLCDCFFREFQMGIACKNFTVYPNPQAFSAVWLVSVIVTSMFLIVYAIRLPECPNFKSMLIHLRGQKNFYKLCVTLLLVLTYDFITILGLNQWKATLVYTIFILEHITAIALMILLSFFPKLVKKDESQYRLKAFAYKITLLVYSFENYVVYALGTITAAYKLVSVPTCTAKQLENKYNTTRLAWLTATQGKNTGECHDATSVIMFLLLLILTSLRHQLGDFFLTKLFEENTDDLVAPPKSKETFQQVKSADQIMSTDITPLLSRERDKEGKRHSYVGQTDEKVFKMPQEFNF